MRKITLVFLFFLSFSTFAQSKNELKRRSGDVKFLEKIQKKNNTDDLLRTFIGYRLFGLKDVVVLTEDQTKTFVRNLQTDFPLLQDAQKKYLESKSVASKLELIKLIVKSEEDFRKILTPEQLVFYSSYGNKIITNVSFDDNYMNDETFVKYKKQLL